MGPVGTDKVRTAKLQQLQEDVKDSEEKQVKLQQELAKLKNQVDKLEKGGTDYSMVQKT